MTPRFGLTTLSMIVFLSVCQNILASGQVQATTVHPAQRRKHWRITTGWSAREFDKEQLCAEKTITGCYGSYLDTLMSTLLSPTTEHPFVPMMAMERPGDVQACSRLKARLPCHKRMESCPMSVLEKFTEHEESYKYIESVFCNGSTTNSKARTRRAIEIAGAVQLCVDIKRLVECNTERLRELRQQESTHMSSSTICKTLLTSGECVRKSLKSACSITYDLLKTPIDKAANALARLADCDSSASSASSLSSVPSASCQTSPMPAFLVAVICLISWMTASL